MTDEKRAVGFHEVVHNGHADVVYVDEDGYAEGAKCVVAFSLDEHTHDPPIKWGRYLGTGEPKSVVLQAACDLATALVSSGALPWRQDDLEHEIREVLDSCSGEMSQADFDAYTAHCVEVNRGR